MVNQHKINDVIDELELRDKNYMIYMGGSLCIRGVRLTNDLDICVEPEMFLYLAKKYNKENDIYIALVDRKFDLEIEDFNVEIFERTNFDDEYEIVDGLKCQTLDEIIKMKRRFNREKDQKDIIMLKELRDKAQ